MLRVGYGISGTNILSIGRGVSVGGGGGEVIKPTFLLRDDFLTDEAAPLASPRAAEPGPGTGTIVDTSNYLSVSGGRLVHTSSVNSGDPRNRYGALARSTGRTAVGKFTPNGGRNRFGFVTSTAAGGNDAAALEITPTHQLYAMGSVGISTPLTVVNGTQYQWAIVQRSSGAFGLVKGGVLDEWTLLWVDDAESTASLYPQYRAIGTSSSQSIDTLRVTDLAGPWADDFGIATQRLSGARSAGDTYTHEANCLVEWTQTTVPSADYTDVHLRRVDADNTLVVSVASDGTIELFEVSGGNWTLLGSSAGAVSNGHRLVVVCDGTTIRIYGNNELRITGDSLVNQNATAGRLGALGTGGAVSNVVSWPRTISGIAKQWLDAAIAD